MIKKTSELIVVSLLFYFMSILGLMVYTYQNPSIIEDIGVVQVFKNLNVTINISLIVVVILTSLMDSLSKNFKNFLGSTSLFVIYQSICYFITKYLIQKVARNQSGKDLIYFVVAPVILYLVFIICIKIVSYILYGKVMYREIKLLGKKAPSWKRFKKYDVSGFIESNIFAELSSADGFIGASCSNIISPDYYYKRFSLDEEGYYAAYNWIMETGKCMHKSRALTADTNGNIRSSIPQTYEWNQENIKNEPCLFGIEVN